MAGDGVDAMWFLPSALNAKVKEFNQARLNGWSNYLKVAKCLFKFVLSYVWLWYLSIGVFKLRCIFEYLSCMHLYLKYTYSNIYHACIHIVKTTISIIVFHELASNCFIVAVLIDCGVLVCFLADVLTFLKYVLYILVHSRSLMRLSLDGRVVRLYLGQNILIPARSRCART